MRTKFYFLLMGLLTTGSALLAQYDNTNRRDSNKISNARLVTANLRAGKSEMSDVPVPLSRITFVDVRYDTSFVTLNWGGIVWWKNLNSKYNLEGGLAAGLSDYTNDYFSTKNKPGEGELVCFIKKFAITAHNEMLDHYNAGKDYFEFTVEHVATEIECFYASGGSLYPALRVDTSYEYEFRKGMTFANAIRQVLKPLLWRIEQVNPATLVQRNRYTREDAGRRYQQRFTLPVLQTEHLQKGVYRTFEEFRNNAPSVNTFSLKIDKLKFNAGNVALFDATSLMQKAIQKRNSAVFLYDTKDQLIPPSTIFGYSDGETFWIQHGAFFYPLVRTGNSFEFMYAYHYADADHRSQVVYILMPLNMDTGKSN